MILYVFFLDSTCHCSMVSAAANMTCLYATQGDKASTAMVTVSGIC
jgi:hypothetical protein